MKEVLIKEYNNLFRTKKISKSLKNDFIVSFLKGAKLEITDKVNKKYKVQFINQKNKELIHESELTNNMWSKTSTEYFINYNIIVKDLDSSEILFEHKFNAKDKRVYIHFDSKALGDTLAWFPYAEEFRKKHQCELIVSTFHNDMFKENYPDITFANPGEIQYNLYAMYEMGWHYKENEEIDERKNPSNFRLKNLQESSAEVLGVEYKEIKPNLTFVKSKPIIEDPYVCIAPHASAHAKYWNNPGGWQSVIDDLNTRGYKVMMITLEPLGDEWHDSKLGGKLKNVIDRTGKIPLSEIANDIMNAEAFIGVSSGLSWLAWSLKSPIVMISGFSEPFTEFKDCERISSPINKCSGCFNRTILDAGDWEWCPDHKDTDRMFECTKEITPDVVIKAVHRQLEKSS
tara:strand:- start:1416 stop:2618 length:1203 start_codon:yes stop_codon:yes gene_type:complete